MTLHDVAPHFGPVGTRKLHRHPRRSLAGVSIAQQLFIFVFRQYSH